MERIFREEGVIDAESPSEEEDIEPLKMASQSESAEDEVIGHLETVEGQDLGELVVSSRALGPRRPKVKKRKRYECKLCRRGFVNRSTYVLHAAYHKEARFECTTCRQLFTSEEDLASHRTHTGHTAEPLDEHLVKQVLSFSVVYKKYKMFKNIKNVPQQTFLCVSAAVTQCVRHNICAED